MSGSLHENVRQVQDAATLMQRGDFHRAASKLEALLKNWPGDWQAHWLLAGARMHCGNFREAELAARVAVNLAPDNASAHALLGEALAGQNKMAEAEKAEHKALELASIHPQATVILARILQAQNRFDESLAHLESQMKRGLLSKEVRLLRAKALLSLGRVQEAQAAYLGITQSNPQDEQAVLGLTAAYLEAGDARVGGTTIRAAMARGVDTPESAFLLARAESMQGRFEQAERELRRALSMRADYPAARMNLAELVWMRTGDLGASTREMDVALHTNPHNSELRIFKAKLMEWAASPEDALKEIESGLALDPSDRTLVLAASQTALKCDPQRALAYGERLVATHADSRPVMSAYGNALLACGHAGEATVVAERMRAANPHDGHAIALLASAWRVLGDPRYRQLYDYEHSVRASQLDVPNGWASLHDYLTDLANSLQRMHTLNSHPIGQTLRTGTQIDLSGGQADDPAVKAFTQAIDGPIHRYMEWIGHGDDLLRSRNTRNWKMAGIWSVRLRASGYHVNHYHPDGWLSSACYIDLPAGVGSENHEGWIQFGQPGIPVTPMPDAEYFVRPEPGMLVLFPSWMWHGTVPFRGGAEDRRLTIAFDVVPA